MAVGNAPAWRAVPRVNRNPERSDRLTRHSLVVAAILSMGVAACGGNPAFDPAAARSNAATGAPVPVPTLPADYPATFRGDGSQMPSWGGWAYGNVPADAV